MGDIAVDTSLPPRFSSYNKEQDQDASFSYYSSSSRSSSSSSNSTSCFVDDEQQATTTTATTTSGSSWVTRRDDLCGGFRLFPSRPSFLSFDDDKDVAASDEDKNSHHDDNDNDDTTTTNTEKSMSSSLACITPRRRRRRRHRQHLWEAWGNNNDKDNHHDDPAAGASGFWCPPHGRLLVKNNHSQQPPLTLSPSFAWLTAWMDDQQQSNHTNDGTTTTTTSATPTSTSTSFNPLGGKQQPYTAAEVALSDNTIAGSATDLARPRQVWIVTTAALPWMTGTAVNPLLRAAYLVQRYHQYYHCRDVTNSVMVHDNEEEGIFYDVIEDEASNIDTDEEGEEDAAAVVWKVTLVLPWLERPEDRVELYGADWENTTTVQQEEYIRHWLSHKAEQALAAELLHIEWYRARYYTPYRSIFAAQDLCEFLQKQVPPHCHDNIDDDDDDDEEYNALDDPHCPVCILEEPEHLFLYRAMQSTATNTASTVSSASLTDPKSTKSKQQQPKHPLAGFYTLSIIHTNYKSYAAQGGLGFVSEMLAGALCAVVAQGYSDKIIKLSATLQDYAPHKETVVNVHGIRQDFLNVPPPTGNDIYFIGKLLWAKGLDKLLRYQRLYAKRKGKRGEYFALDIYGSGPDEQEIQAAFINRPVTFCGRLDHAALPTRYKIFCNPSISEVLCTTSAEALAMNKFVLLPRHPSNDFFEPFPNALLYRTPQEFCSLLLYAQSNDPVPLSDELRHKLSWQAATDRLIAAAATSPRELARLARVKASRDMRCYEWHASVCRGRLGKTLQKSFFGTFEEEEDEEEKEEENVSISKR